MNIDDLLGRYTPDDRSVVFCFLEKLAATTRETGKISESKKVKIIASFESFDVDIVIASLNTYLRMGITPTKGGKGKNEKYVRGIMTNKQDEKDSKAGDGIGGSSGDIGSSGKKRAAGMEGDEGTRLQQLADSADGGELECDF